MNEEEFRKQLIRKLDGLGTKVDALIQVLAITSRKEVIAKGKTKTDQIVILSELGLSNDVIALIIGSTPEAVRVRIAQLKAAKKKIKQSKDVEKSDE
jgi:Na+-transporting NADH:ubiquinone oxidoreductase subunit NqrD